MPIAMTKDEWSRLAKWKSMEDPEVTRRREYVKYLDETSREMTKQWPNSVEVCIIVFKLPYITTDYTYMPMVIL